MFVVDPEGETHTIPRTNNKIEWIDRSYFRITDEKGVEYTFGKNCKEETTMTIIYDGDREVRPAYISTWYFETISFTYELGDVYKFSNYDEEFLVEVSGANLNKPVITAEVVKKEKWKLA